MICARGRRLGAIGVAMIALAGVRTMAQMPTLPLYDTQTPVPGLKVPEYEVASIKEDKSANGGMRIMTKPDGFSGTNLNLKLLLANAYGIRQDLISGGPGWMESTGFDVELKVAGEDVETMKKLTYAQRRSMMLSVLTERFHLKAHIETKIMPIYELSIAKGGVKMKEAPAVEEQVKGFPEDGAKPPPNGRYPGRIMMMPGGLEGTGLPLRSLCDNLSNVLEHKVVDKTGLTGKYDFTLKYTPENNAAPSGDADAAPSLFTAVQEQLGLALKSAKGPEDILVIDHVEMPTEN